MAIKNRGFTLVELLVVVSVLSVLTGVILVVIKPSYFHGKGRDARRRSDLEAVRGALELYYLDETNDRSYPATNYPGLGSLLAPYLDRVPQDPLAGQSYDYTQRNQQCYRLSALNETEGGRMVACGGPKSCQLPAWGCP